MTRVPSLILLVLAFAFFPCGVRGQGSKALPNVVLIIADQMRGDALGAQGHPDVRTPNLDRLAAEGVLFANFFTNNPVCVPSRQSFFTGRYPNQHGSLANIGSGRLGALEGTLLDHFRNRGYRTGYIGKDHTYADGVLDSLDVFVERGREPFRGYGPYVPPYWHADMYWPEESLHATHTTRDGVDFIETSGRGDRPFFLTLSYFDPHPPYFAPAEYAGRYDAEAITIPPYVPPGQLSGRLAEHQRALHYDRIDDADLAQTLKYYYASIEWGVDYQVGQVLEALERNGLVDNTIVVVTSEHGDFMGQHRMVRKGMFLYDALLHVPFIVYAPGRTAAGLRTEALAQGVDLLPTLVDLTGGDVPAGLPGRSLVPLLEGQEGDEEDRVIFAMAAYSDLPSDYFDNPEPPQYGVRGGGNTPFTRASSVLRGGLSTGP